MKHFNLSLLLCVVALLPLDMLRANSTTTRSGFITAAAAGGNVYEISCELILTSSPMVGDVAYVDFGDGNTSPIGLDTCSQFAYGPFYWKITLLAYHTYSPGAYYATVTCGKRIPWISNIPTSDTTAFVVSCEFLVDPNLGSNTLPLQDAFDMTPILSTGSTDTFIVNSYDVDVNDSIAYTRTIPFGAPGFVQPETIGGGTFTFDGTNNYASWDAQIPGMYVVVFSFAQWTEITPGNWIMTGLSMREILINAGNATSVNDIETGPIAVPFPNPSAEQCVFSFSDNAQRELIVCDAAGREVWSIRTNAAVIVFPSEQFAEGHYVFALLEGADRSYGKLVVER